MMNSNGNKTFWFLDLYKTYFSVLLVPSTEIVEREFKWQANEQVPSPGINVKWPLKVHSLDIRLYSLSLPFLLPGFPNRCEMLNKCQCNNQY